jgi:hypothetical protein
MKIQLSFTLVRSKMALVDRIEFGNKRLENLPRQKRFPDSTRFRIQGFNWVPEQNQIDRPIDQWNRSYSYSPLLIAPTHRSYSSFLLIVPTHRYSSLLLIAPTHRSYSSLLLIAPTHRSYSSLLLIAPTHRSYSWSIWLIDLTDRFDR